MQHQILIKDHYIPCLHASLWLNTKNAITTDTALNILSPGSPPIYGPPTYAAVPFLGPYQPQYMESILYWTEL